MSFLSLKHLPNHRDPEEDTVARNSKKVVVEEVDEELEELEEIEDDEAPAPKKGKKAAKAAAPAKKAKPAADEDEDETPTYGASWLADLVNETYDKEYTAANIRVLLRKMAKSGELDREVGEDRSRYSFSGPKDAAVKAVLAHVKAGTLEKEKAERLEAVKANKAAKKSTKAAAADEDEDEEEAPAPKAKKATRRR